MSSGERQRAMTNDPKDWMWAEACAVLDRVQQMHRQFFRPGVVGMQVAAWQPPIDIFEDADDLRIVVALPGVELSDIDVTVERDNLVIAGMRHLPGFARSSAIHRVEIPYGRFERQVQLSSGRLEIGRPKLSDGCLFITLAKRS